MKIEAIHIVAAAIDAANKRGTPEQKEADALVEELKRIWRKQRRVCPKCGNVCTTKSF